MTETKVQSIEEHQKFLLDNNSHEKLINFFQMYYINPIESEIGKEKIRQDYDNKKGIYSVKIGNKELIVNTWSNGVTTFHIEKKNEKNDGIPVIRVKFKDSKPKFIHAEPNGHEIEDLKRCHLDMVAEKLLSN